MRERAQAKIVDVDARIATLKRMRKSLAGLMHTCDGTAPVAKCPIVVSLKAGRQPGGLRAQG